MNMLKYPTISDNYLAANKLKIFLKFEYVLCKRHSKIKHAQITNKGKHFSCFYLLQPHSEEVHNKEKSGTAHLENLMPNKLQEKFVKRINKQIINL